MSSEGRKEALACQGGLWSLQLRHHFGEQLGRTPTCEQSTQAGRCKRPKEHEIMMRVAPLLIEAVTSEQLDYWKKQHRGRDKPDCHANRHAEDFDYQYAQTLHLDSPTGFAVATTIYQHGVPAARHHPADTLKDICSSVRNGSGSVGRLGAESGPCTPLTT